MQKKVICIGNALVDKVCLLENDELLQEENLPKGSMHLIDTTESIRLLHKTQHLQSRRTTGGSAANTAIGTANMGISTAYVGMVGEDELGTFYIDSIKQNNITPRIFRTPNSQTGLALALVSPDGERTFATNLGAALSLSDKEIDKSLFAGYDYLHIEGYLISNRVLFRKIMEAGRQARCKISIDLASYNVVEENLQFLKEVCRGVSIIFANEEEAKAFTGKEAEKALDQIAEYAETAVVKIGMKGSLIKHHGETCHIHGSKRSTIDTTGAGDMYAGGFLAALCQDKNLLQCGKTGSILAGNVVEVMGTAMDAERWQKIKAEVENI